MSLPLLETLLKVTEKALTIYDRAQKTKYLKQYRKILEEIQEEEAKPVYTGHDDVDPSVLRDMNLIDRLQFNLMVLLDKFVKEAGLKDEN